MSIILLCLAPLSAADVFEGTWVLNRSKSTGQIPLAETVVIRESSNQLIVEIAIKDSRQASQKLAIRYRVPVTGGMGHIEEGPYDDVEVKRLNSRTLETSYFAKGKRARSTRAILSLDGKTIASTGRTALSGELESWVMVFDRQ